MKTWFIVEHDYGWFLFSLKVYLIIVAWEANEKKTTNGDADDRRHSDDIMRDAAGAEYKLECFSLHASIKDWEM